MDDYDVWVIVPLGTIGIIFFAVFITGASIVNSVQEWFVNNLVSIIRITVIGAIIITLISSIYLKSILVAINSLLCFSQSIFFLVYWGTRLESGDGFFEIIGHLIIFIIYVVVAGLDIFGSCYFPISGIGNTRGSISITVEESADNTVTNCFILGLIGWIANIILILLITFIS